jgi:hypothetical protein
MKLPTQGIRWWHACALVSESLFPAVVVPALSTVTTRDAFLADVEHESERLQPLSDRRHGAEFGTTIVLTFASANRATTLEERP